MLDCIICRNHFTWDSKRVAHQKWIITEKSNHSCKQILHKILLQEFESIKRISYYLCPWPTKCCHKDSEISWLNKRKYTIENHKSTSNLLKNRRQTISRCSNKRKKDIKSLHWLRCLKPISKFWIIVPVKLCLPGIIVKNISKLVWWHGN
jgi:hypothetical protein